MSDLLKQVEQSISRRRLLQRGQKLLIAVSGGLDSMVLLDLLNKLSRKYSWRLTVAHLNHQLRGRSSDADERLVIRTARAFRLPVISEQADVKSAARNGKCSVEMAARQVRHEFLARTAIRLRIPTVVLAHHADDQLELFFLRLLRGSGNEGLAGMKFRNPSSANSKIELVRPLLDQPRAALQEYARERKVRFREDATNASLDFQRNRIRHELLPLLRRKYQPALDRTLSRVIDIAAAESEAIGRMAAEWLNGKRRARFKDLAIALQRRCLQLQLHSIETGPHRQKIPVDFELVEHLRTRPDHFIKVSAESSVMADAEGKVCLREAQPDSGSNPAQSEVELSGNEGEIKFGNMRIQWRIRSGKGRGLPTARQGLEVFDADKIGPRIVLRHWRAGDRFQPIGMRSSVKLQDLFTNQKIPRIERQSLVLAAAVNGELFWVERLRISEHFKWSKQTNRRLQWQWKRL